MIDYNQTHYLVAASDKADGLVNTGRIFVMMAPKIRKKRPKTRKFLLSRDLRRNFPVIKEIYASIAESAL